MSYSNPSPRTRRGVSHLMEEEQKYRQRQWSQQRHGNINNYSELEKSQVVQLY